MYRWVSCGSVHKYNRAIAQLQKDKKEVTEEAVKALYVKMAGLLMEEKVEELVIEKLRIGELRKLAEERNIESEGLTREELIAVLS